MLFRNALPSFAVLVLAAPNLGFAQEEVEYEQEQGAAIIVSATDDTDGMGISSTRVMAIDSSDLANGPMYFADSVDGSFSFGDGFVGNSFSMLNNPSVQKDLQLVDDQLGQIKSINEQFSEKIKEQMDQMKDENGNFNFQHGSDFGQLIRDLREQQKDQIASILLPNQQKRLEQVTRQMRMKRSGTASTLTGKLAEELGLSDEQKKRIKTRSRELQEELKTKMAELRASAKKQLLDELTAEQKNRLEELIGDEYIEKEEDSKNQFQRLMRRKKSNSRDF